MKTLRIALLGTAHVHVADHLAIVQADPAAELVAVYDRDPRNVEVLGELPASLTVHEALSTADLAVVDSTTAEHEDLVPQVVAAGLAFFVEKPLGDSLQTTRKLASLVDGAGVQFATGMFLRCLPALIRIRALLGGGTLGNLSAAHARFTHAGMLDGAFTGTAAWMRQPAEGGAGGFADLGIHCSTRCCGCAPTHPFPSAAHICSARPRRTSTTVEPRCSIGRAPRPPFMPAGPDVLAVYICTWRARSGRRPSRRAT